MIKEENFDCGIPSPQNILASEPSCDVRTEVPQQNFTLMRAMAEVRSANFIYFES